MLQITPTAAMVFRKILDQPDIDAHAIRLVPAEDAGDELDISVEAVDRPAPSDRPADAEGVTVVVAAEIASALDGSVLDAREVDGGADLFLRSEE